MCAPVYSHRYYRLVYNDTCMVMIQAHFFEFDTQVTIIVIKLVLYKHETVKAR